MHYRVNNGIVESELAAKSVFQPNKYVLEYILSLNPTDTVLDYGCGKLRYTIPLSRQVKSVVAIDSEEQIEKIQMISGKKTALSQYHVDNVLICPIHSSAWKNQTYDVIICTNVLSAIPYRKERIKLLKNAKSVLKNTGTIYITTQYRNSYFSKYNGRDGVERFNDGWLIPRKKNKYSFYAPLNSNEIIDLCVETGFVIDKCFQKDGSCFIFASKAHE